MDEKLLWLLDMIGDKKFYAIKTTIFKQIQKKRVRSKSRRNYLSHLFLRYIKRESVEKNTGDRLKGHFQQTHEIITPNICILRHSKLINYLPVWSVMQVNAFCIPFLLNCNNLFVYLF